MNKTTSIITLTTDFGLIDSYAGIMKGIILSFLPQVHIIDLSHSVPRQNCFKAGIILKNSFSFFPEKTVHCCVVDPGVGTDRKILAALYHNHLFLAPDNGILSIVFENRKPEKIVSVENEKFFLSRISNTFHGRDKFAPVASFLAQKRNLDEFGPNVSSWAKIVLPKPIWENPSLLIGEVIDIDIFGNLITNISMDDMPNISHIEINQFVIKKISKSYSENPKGNILAIPGSSGFLEISINQGSAQNRLKGAIGMPLYVHL